MILLFIVCHQKNETSLRLNHHHLTWKGLSFPSCSYYYSKDCFLKNCFYHYLLTSGWEHLVQNLFAEEDYYMLNDLYY
jgi:hypothetical protein